MEVSLIKIKLINIILLVDFILYIFSNLLIFEYSPSNTYSIIALCLRDSIIFLFSIAVYSYNFNISSLLVFPKLNSKIVKNSIIIGLIFYVIANGVNIIFTTFFGFTLKSRVYLNSIQHVYNLGLGLIVYIIVHSIFTELFFRGILNDTFKILSYRFKLVLSSFLFAIFFFGLSRIIFGFIIGILLMSFLNKVGNILPVIVSSITINVIDYIGRLLGKRVLSDGIGERILLRNSDVFIDLIFPIIIILIGLIVYQVILDRMPIKKNIEVLPKNVTKVDFNNNSISIIDKYFVLFLLMALIVQLISYFLMN